MQNPVVLLLAVATVMSCGKKNDDERSRNESKAARAFLYQHVRQPFLDTSSELRCDALKEFFVTFAERALDGASVVDYSCTDASNVEERYMTKVQFTKNNNTTVVIQHVSGSLAYDTEYCGLPFDPNTYPTCGIDAYFVAGGTKTDGFMHPNLSKLKEFVQVYIGEEQNQDLAYGIETKEFAEKWVGKLNGLYKYSLASTSGTQDLWINLTPGGSDKAGSAAIIDADISGFESGHSLFGCKDKQCLVTRDYQYIFNGHRLVIVTADGNILTLFLPKPE